MARARKKAKKRDYAEIVAEYQTGQISIPELAVKYGCNRTALYDYIRRHGIEVNDNLRQGIDSVRNGIIALNEEREKAEIDKMDQNRRRMAILKGFEYLEKFGDFGVWSVQVLKKGLQRGNDFLDSANTASEYNDAMSGIKKAVDTLGLFPKTPLVAVQNNVGVSKGKDEKKAIEIKVSFLQNQGEIKGDED